VVALYLAQALLSTIEGKGTSLGSLSYHFYNYLPCGCLTTLA